MSVSQRPPIPSLIPESAPFTVEQRTWLNGLFGLPENVTPVSTADATKLLAGLLDGAVGAAVPQNDAGTTRRCRCPIA
jgi:sulfite reductase (NADPH) flavoprotein alpha-component